MIAGLAPSRCCALSRGDVLFRQGDPATAIYRVASGRLRLERRTADGRHVILHNARPGELFAEASLFADTYHCDAVAIQASRVEVYRRTQVLRLFRQDPGAAENLLATLARQLQAVRARLELRNVRSARERVMLWLETRADRDRVVILDGPLQDIAAELGLTREALYRTIAILERDEAVERDGANVRLRGPAA